MKQTRLMSLRAILDIVFTLPSKFILRMRSDPAWTEESMGVVVEEDIEEASIDRPIAGRSILIGDAQDIIVGILEAKPEASTQDFIDAINQFALGEKTESLSA